MGAGMAVFDTFVEDGDQILDAGAFDDHEIFYEETVFAIPTSVEDSTFWVEEITKLLVVNLKKTGFNVKFLCSLSHLFPHVSATL
jgi:hypothetical protein